MIGAIFWAAAGFGIGTVVSVAYPEAWARSVVIVRAGLNRLGRLARRVHVEVTKL